MGHQGSSSTGLLSACLMSSLLSACHTPATAPSVGMANPASAYCIEQGGRLDIIQGDEGELGMCHLPDGTVIEEWALFRRDHPQS